MLLWLQRAAGMPADELADGLENRSGLQGLAGSKDMRDILAGADREEPAASLALDVYSHRLRAGIAAMTAALGGIDGLIFTGGIGENSPAVRQRAIDGLGFLGLSIDRDRNRNGIGDREIGAGGSPSVVVVSAREDLQIAREVRMCLAG
jgi:acetate kinase